MKILKLTLDGFKRFSFSKTGKLDVVMDAKLILILGQNGMGKSSVMKELSPLPAQSSDFHKGGSKYIEIEYNNSIYKLTQTFESGTGKFSFIKDNEELNPGHTVTVYKDLVFKYFNLDNQVFQLLTGETSFIFYSNQERKNWITRISDNDLTYAISFYNKNKEILRDLQGSVKLSKTKLLQENDKLISSEEYAKLKLLIEDTISLVDKLLALRDNAFIDPLQLKSLIQETEQRITQSTERLSSTIKSYPYHINQYKTSEGIEEDIIATQTTMNTLLYHKQDIQKKLEDNLTTISTLKKANASSREATETRIAELNNQIAKLNSQMSTLLSVDNPSVTLSNYLSIYDNLQDIFLNLVEDPYHTYTREYYQSKAQHYDTLTKHIGSLEASYRVYTSKKQELEAKKRDAAVECPKCHHSWYLNYSEVEYQTVTKAIDQIFQDTEKAKLEHKQLEEHLIIVKQQLTLLNNYNSLVKNWFSLSPIWQLLESSVDFYTNPRNIVPKLDIIKQDLQTIIEISKLTEEKKELEKALTLLQSDSQISISKLEETHERYNKDLHDATVELRTLASHLEYVKTLKGVLSSIQQHKNALEALLELHSTHLTKAVSYKRRQAIDEIIKTIRLYIADKETLLSKQTIQASIVDNIKKTIDESETLIAYHKAIEKTLSPTEGLIAKSLTGFINTFVLQVNSFIKKIWSYPLELATIVPDENLDINYKFKVIINENIVIPDIVRLSSAQKEIVDLAIRIVSMKYLKITDYPLYLDEFAAKMDANHRKAAFYTISNLLLNSNFSQIYLINHYQDQHGSLKNAKIIDLAEIA